MSADYQKLTNGISLYFVLSKIFQRKKHSSPVEDHLKNRKISDIFIVILVDKCLKLNIYCSLFYRKWTTVIKPTSAEATADECEVAMNCVISWLLASEVPAVWKIYC